MNKSRPKRSNKISIFQPVIRLHDVHTNKYTGWAFNSFVSQLVSSVLFMVEQLDCLDFSRAINSAICLVNGAARSVCWALSAEKSRKTDTKYIHRAFVVIVIFVFVVVVVVDTTKQNGITETYKWAQDMRNCRSQIINNNNNSTSEGTFLFTKDDCQRQNTFYLVWGLLFVADTSTRSMRARTHTIPFWAHKMRQSPQ